MSSGSEEISESDFFINKSDVELLGLELVYEDDLPSLNYLIKTCTRYKNPWCFRYDIEKLLHSNSDTQLSSTSPALGVGV